MSPSTRSLALDAPGRVLRHRPLRSLLASFVVDLDNLLPLQVLGVEVSEPKVLKNSMM
jgi:hypothetical protein